MHDEPVCGATLMSDKSPLDKARAQLRTTIGGLFLTAFLLGLAHQFIVPLFYAAGILSAIFLVRLAVSHFYRR
jgi:hypothetical protein